MTAEQLDLEASAMFSMVSVQLQNAVAQQDWPAVNWIADLLADCALLLRDERG